MVTKLISNNSIEEGMLRCAKYKLRLEEQMTTNEDAGKRKLSINIHEMEC